MAIYYKGIHNFTEDKYIDLKLSGYDLTTFAATSHTTTTLTITPQLPHPQIIYNFTEHKDIDLKLSRYVLTTIDTIPNVTTLPIFYPPPPNPPSDKIKGSAQYPTSGATFVMLLIVKLSGYDYWVPSRFFLKPTLTWSNLTSLSYDL